MNVFRLLLTLCLCLLVCAPFSARASEASPSGSLDVVDENAENQSWKLNADKLTSIDDGVILEAEGSVFLQRGTEYLKADYARYYPSTNWVYLRGNVDVRMGKDAIQAESAEFDLRSRTGWLNNGNIFMEGPHMYFSGERILKHRGDRYTFNNAKITACDGDVPAWSVAAEEATVEIDGYARLYRSSFQIKDTPVVSAPFLIMPAKTTRQSGFLMPDYGISKKRGFYYTQPYFQVLDESRDVTYFATIMEKMGPMASVQYRSHTSLQDKTWLMGSVNAARDRNTNPANDPSGNNLARTNWDRYWLRGMSDGHLGSTPWRYRLNVDYVSDQNFLRQFSSGPIGFDDSRDESFAMFGRDLREDDQKRLNTGTLYRDWDRVGVALSTRYEQDATLGNGNRRRSEDETVQQLPKLEGFLYKGRLLPQLPFECEMHASTAYMYRSTGTRGMRSEIYPRLSLPWDLKYASIIATGGLRSTFYNTDNAANTDPLRPFAPSLYAPKQSNEDRILPDLDIQLYTEAERIWNLTSDDDPVRPAAEYVGKTDWTGLRHQIQPRLRYRVTPNKDQQHNPFYVLEDRINATNELTYSITNVITRKATTITQVPGKEGEEPSYVATESYKDLVWWKLQAGYDYEEASRTQHRDTYERRPFMDIYSEIEFSPLDWLAYNNKLYISPHDGELSRYDHALIFSPWHWFSWSTGLSYRTSDYELRERLQYDDERDIIRESPLHLMYNQARVQFNETWGLEYYEYRDMRTNDVYDRKVDLSYTDQCYRFIARMQSDDRDQSFTLLVELPGFFE